MPARDAPSVAQVKAEFEKLNDEVAAEKERALDEAVVTVPDAKGRRLQFNSREWGWCDAEELSVFEAPGGRLPRPGCKNLRFKAPDGRIMTRVSVAPVGTEVRLWNGLSMRAEKIPLETVAAMAQSGQRVADLPPGRVYREI